VSRAPLPAGLVRIRSLLVPRGNLGRRARPWRVLTDYRTAADLWAAVECGQFPLPARGPWGVAWCLSDVLQWRRRQGLDVETPRTVRSGRGVR